MIVTSILSVAAIVLSAVTFYYQFLHEDIKIELVLSESYVHNVSEYGSTALVGKYNLGFVNTGNRPAIITRVSQHSFRADRRIGKSIESFFNEQNDYDVAKESLRSIFNRRKKQAILRSRSACEHGNEINESHFLPKNEAPFSYLVVKSGEIAAKDFVLASASLTSDEIRKEKSIFVVACLHIELFTGDGNLHIAELPVLPVKLEYREMTVTFPLHHRTTVISPDHSGLPL